MNDEQFEELLRETLDEYHRPGETPRDAIWRQVAEKRRKVTLLPWWRRPVTRIDLLIGAAAALLLLVAGIQVGRMTMAPAPAPSMAVSDPLPAGDGEVNLGRSADAEASVLRLAATRSLSRSESFLTRYRADDPAAVSDPRTLESARRLLTEVRLLLATSAADDPELRPLLNDLELVLAQILQASADTTSHERRRVQKRLNDHSLLPRLRNLIPAGREAAVPQEVQL
jgi:hypothetical protein